MVFCKKCGYEGAYLGKFCPSCKAEFSFDKDELLELKEIIEDAASKKEHETVVEGCHILADFGDTDAQREYARLLEKGDGVAVDLDAATEYYRRAAEKLDVFSAYRYSVLVSRMNGAVGDFWLEFSAFLGCKEAYLDASRLYRKEKNYSFSNHYLYLAAMADDTDAIVELAEKYYTGDGIEQSSEFAKWYMDKLTFPPLYAIRLALKLRSKTAKEAPNIAITDKRTLVIFLLGRAKKTGLEYPAFYLTSLLFDMGDMEMGAELGKMFLEGKGTAKCPEEGIRALSRAAASGSSNAYITLGTLYYEGEVVERNQKFALECFERASNLGSAEACELLGDIYHSPSFEGRNVAHSATLYKKAASLGSSTAAQKHEKIIKFREEYYERALRIKKSSPEEAFKLFFVADAMGHTPAKLQLAAAYASGSGVKSDRSLAFAYYKAAASEGCDDAYYPLGLCYAHGFGTNFNFRLATENLTRADRLGSERAREEILRLYEQKKKRLSKKLYSTAMRLIYTGKLDTARSYLELSRKFGNAKATYALGCICEFGRGELANRSRAYELYAEAEAEGFSDVRSAYKLKILRLIKNAD